MDSVLERRRNHEARVKNGVGDLGKFLRESRAARRTSLTLATEPSGRRSKRISSDGSGGGGCGGGGAGGGGSGVREHWCTWQVPLVISRRFFFFLPLLLRTCVVPDVVSWANLSETGTMLLLTAAPSMLIAVALLVGCGDVGPVAAVRGPKRDSREDTRARLCCPCPAHRGLCPLPEPRQLAAAWTPWLPWCPGLRRRARPPSC